MDIQLFFDFPQDGVSVDMMTSEISITFWGTQFFTSEDGEQVRYGSTLKTAILRQVKPGLHDQLQFITLIGMGVLAVLLILFALVLLITGDSPLPIWIFLNSLTLIVHTVVLKTELPNEVFLVLKIMLKALRLDFLPLDSTNHVKPPEEFLMAGY
jgi:hypothetical protein